MNPSAGSQGGFSVERQDDQLARLHTANNLDHIVPAQSQHQRTPFCGAVGVEEDSRLVVSPHDKTGRKNRDLRLAFRLDEDIGSLTDGPVRWQFEDSHIHYEFASLAIGFPPQAIDLASELAIRLRMKHDTRRLVHFEP